jgi:type III pantothenate kinase
MPHRNLLLTLDIGNTNVVLGAFDGAELAAHWRMSTRRNMTADELALTIRGLFELAGLGDPKERALGAAASSVAPPLDRAIREWGARYLGGSLLVVDRSVDLGIGIRYSPPEAVGADRLVNAVAAYHAHGGPCVVVDFGTATTCDAVADNGDYLGGAIFPGVGISLEALVQAASKLPRVELQKPAAAIGKTTTDSLVSGLVYGYAAQVDGMVRRFQTELGGDAKVIATGGLAELICAESETVQSVEPWLTLEGLRLIWQRVRGAHAASKTGSS